MKLALRTTYSLLRTRPMNRFTWKLRFVRGSALNPIGQLSIGNAVSAWLLSGTHHYAVLLGKGPPATSENPDD
jgi:hypothetical protein